MKPEIIDEIRRDGLEFMGCYRGTNQICYFLAGRVENKDYGDKEGYRLDAWKASQGPNLLEHAATLLFFVSRSALATARTKERLAAQPDLLKQLAIAHIKRMLDDGTNHREIVLTSDASDTEFDINDPSGDPLIAQRRLRDEVVRDLAVRHARGERTIRYESLRDRLCANEDWIQRAVRLLGKQNLVTGLSDGNLRLTDDGHLAAEDIVPLAPSAPIPAVGKDKPMDCFVSYAGEDRDTVKALVGALTERSVQVWWDKGQITLGDRLSQKIEEGLRLSRYGIVIISRHFVDKHWPDAELRALHARAMRSGQKVILPVLIGMKHDEFSTTYPLLADLVTTAFNGNIGVLAEEIVRAIRN
jgi:hypothetical protein